MPLLSAAALWYITGLLLAAAGIRRAPQVLALSILAIPAQFLIVERQPVIIRPAGRGRRDSLCSHGVPAAKPVTKTEAWAFLAVIAPSRASPHFGSRPDRTPFTWIPFGGMLAADWQFAVLVMLEKIFWYTSAVWLLRAAGMRLSIGDRRRRRDPGRHRDCAGAPAWQGCRVHRSHSGDPDGLCPLYPFPRNRKTISISRMITTTTSRKNPRPRSNRSTMNS